MGKYLLQQDEVVLYKGNVSITEKVDARGGREARIGGGTELTLTNLNLIIEKTTTKLFKSPEVTTIIYPISDLKIYNDLPQVKQKNNYVDIYFTSTEMTIMFYSKIEAMKFSDKVMELLTGTTKTSRGASKVKSAIGLVDDTLGINTMETLGSVMENGVVKALFKGTKKASPTTSLIPESNDTVKEVVSVAADLITKKVQEPKSDAPELTYDEQIDAVKKLKDLVDAGILTHEEFEAKKKQILNI